MHQVRNDIHPQIYLQQHTNTAHRRLARMTGTREPTAEEMSAAIRKRMVVVENGVGVFRNKQRQPRKHNVGGLDPEPIRIRHAEDAYGGGGGGENGGVAVVTLTTTVTPTPTPTPSGTTKTVTETVTATRSPCAPRPSSAYSPPPTEGGGTNARVGNNNNGFSENTLKVVMSGEITSSTVTPTAPNSLRLDDQANDVGYIATFQIGTPPRDFRFLMDSGSADMWVPSEECESLTGGKCGNHTTLGPKSSSSFKSLGRTFQSSYGTSRIAGDVISDDVVIAGLKLPGHTFGVVTAEASAVTGNNVDGLIGLARSIRSDQKTDTPPESLAKAGLIQAPITSYKISRVADGKNDGEITFGGIDETKIDRSTIVTMNSVNPDGFWEVPFTMSIGGKDLGLNRRTAILDTGAAVIMAPSSDAEAIHAQIPGSKPDGQGGFTLPCTTDAHVALTIGGKSFSIDSRDLLFAPVDPNNTKGDCISGIVTGRFAGPQAWLVGDVFLKNVYFSHDASKGTVTLAKLK
ncbi:unnamed protein product [Rhizoctonia solani]|uniref:Peptidase A1 domain-containing protein n=1 Tax=Rhizoctonia solani TaxID=456999 RepID=A0A8H3HTR3_9AGAM|nr:unnamed protein product [Rhizoctonia solani]